MAFRTNPAPYQRAKNSTLKIMLILCAALIVVWVFGIIYSFKLDGLVKNYVDAFNTKNAAAIERGTMEAMVATSYGLKSILMVLVALVVTAVCDVLTTLIKHKKDSKDSLGKEIVHDLIHNYSYVTAIIFALTLPVYTSYYVIIIGSIFATIVVKNFFGGFGKNIFNPAIMARIFVGLCFASQLAVPEVLKISAAGVDAVSGATLTTAFNNATSWLATTSTSGVSIIHNSIFSDYTLTDMLFGQYVGSLGETFTVVIFVLGIVLSILKVINWRTPVFYLGTVALTSLCIALVCGFENPFSYVLYHLSLGGLMFGAVFMLTDPVTGPTSPYGKSLVAVFAGLMTVLIRVKGGYPEGVMYSIALCNFISPAVDYLTVGKSSSHLVRKSCILVGTCLVAIGLCSGLAYSVNGGKEVYAINGIDQPAYSLLEETFALNDGDSFKKVENYTPKTNNIKGYKIGESSLDVVYDIINQNGEKVATLYSVSKEGSISIEGYYTSITPYVLIGIKTDGSLYGFGMLTPVNSKGYGLENSINEYIHNEYTGKNESNYNDVENLSSATYSSTIIKNLITAAYEEFNAA